MKCPCCAKEIHKNSLFCGFCGASMAEYKTESVETKRDIEKINEPVVAVNPTNPEEPVESMEDTNPEEPVESMEDTKPAEPVEEAKPAKTVKKKKHKGFKILMIFAIISFMAGATLGLLYARGYVSLADLKMGQKFGWTSHSEGRSDVSESTEESEEEKETDPEIETDSETEVETEPETGVETEPETEPETGTETESETGTEIVPESDPSMDA